MNRMWETPAGLMLWVWTRPRLAVWIPALALLIGLCRGLMARWPAAMIIPGFMWIDPGVTLIPLAGLFGGPAGAWAAAAGTAAGDAIGGQWSALTPWRAAGAGLWALSAMTLWDATFWSASPAPDHRPHWGPTLRFLWTAWPGALAAAVITALGSDLYRLYAFPYALVLHAAHHWLFSWVIGVSLYRIISREWTPWWGTWRGRGGLSSTDASMNLRRAALLISGILLAAAGGAIHARSAHGLRMFEAYILGLHAGPGTVGAALPGLLITAAALALPDRRPRGGATQ